MMADLDTLVADASFIGKTFTHGDKTFKVAKADNYGYTDPIDGSVSKKQVNIWNFWKEMYTLPCEKFQKMTWSVTLHWDQFGYYERSQEQSLVLKRGYFDSFPVPRLLNILTQYFMQGITIVLE